MKECWKSPTCTWLGVKSVRYTVKTTRRKEMWKIRLCNDVRIIMFCLMQWWRCNNIHTHKYNSLSNPVNWWSQEKDSVKACRLLVQPARPALVCNLSGKCQRQFKCRANLLWGRLLHFYVEAIIHGDTEWFPDNSGEKKQLSSPIRTPAHKAHSSMASSTIQILQWVLHLLLILFQAL